MEEKNNTKKYIFIIVLLLIVILALGGYIVYDKVVKNEKIPVTNEKENKDKKESVTEQKNNITKEEVNSFLKGMALNSGNVTLFLFNNLDDSEYLSNTDEHVFFNSISYLVFSNKYVKNGDLYVFNEGDIRDLARIYYMKDNFQYITTDSNFVYDSANKTFSSKLDFGLSYIGPNIIERTADITQFDVVDGEAQLVYNVKTVKDSSMFANPDDAVSDLNYKINIVKIDGELRIKSISH